MSIMNRLANSGNRFQGKFKRVLCVCSAGLLRSPTAAFVLSQEPYNYNTRSVGVSEEFALTPIDEVFIDWAEEIVCMEQWQEVEIRGKLKAAGINRPVHCLNIEDNFAYRDPELINLIKTKYAEVTKTEL